MSRAGGELLTKVSTYSDLKDEVETSLFCFLKDLEDLCYNNELYYVNEFTGISDHNWTFLNAGVIGGTPHQEKEMIVWVEYSYSEPYEDWDEHKTFRIPATWLAMDEEELLKTLQDINKHNLTKEKERVFGTLKVQAEGLGYTLKEKEDD